MKIMSAFVLIFALIALVLTGMYILSNWNPNPGIGLIWKFVSFWPANIVTVISTLINDAAGLLSLGTFMYLCLAIQFGATITAVLLARSLDRSALDWGLATFFFPYAAPFILAMMREH